MSIFKRLAGIEVHQKVALLSLWLLSAMSVVVAVGLLGLHKIQVGNGSGLDQEVETLRLVVLIDRDLYQAQLGIEEARTAASQTKRQQGLEDYRANVGESEDRFTRFTGMQGRDENEAVQINAYRDARAQWLQATARLASEIGVTVEESESRAALEQAQATFFRMHDCMEHVESSYNDLIAGTAATAYRTEAMLLSALGIALVSGLLLTRSCVRAIRAQQDAIKLRNGQREAETARREFEHRLVHGMEMAQIEEDAHKLVDEVLREVAPGMPAELLLADSSKAHLHRVATTLGKESARLCAVGKPYDCPAVRRGQSVRFSTSEAFDACPHLKGRTTGACSAICVPLSIMGKTVGVLHTTGPDRSPAGDELAATLTQIASKAGDRIGVLRAFRRSETQASMDPLTGLFNRRSLEEQVRDLVKSGSPFALAYGDLDHFKQLNDTHGHDTGDRALRLFSRSLRESIRPGDLAARWGGEEFVVIFPGASANDAAIVLERIRTNLTLAQQSAKLPGFTASFGLGDSFDAVEFADLLAMADGALLEAKRAGRNRVVIVGQGVQGDNIGKAA